MTLHPDVIIDVRFRMAAEGGKESPITAPFYSCPMMIDDHGYDCRIFLDGKVELGNTYRLPVKFLDREFAMSHLAAGTRFTLWEGRDVADGSIVAVLKNY
jgi:hypothetical protein